MVYSIVSGVRKFELVMTFSGLDLHNFNTTDSVCVSPEVVDYIRSLIVASKCCILFFHLPVFII